MGRMYYYLGALFLSKELVLYCELRADDSENRMR